MGREALYKATGLSSTQNHRQTAALAFYGAHINSETRYNTIKYNTIQYNTIQSFYSHNSGTKVKKKIKNENTRNYRKRIDRNYITICTIFESVCNSQSSKAFELAAAYLQVKKGTNERNNNQDQTNLQGKKCHENGLEI